MQIEKHEIQGYRPKRTIEREEINGGFVWCNVPDVSEKLDSFLGWENIVVLEFEGDDLEGLNLVVEKLKDGYLLVLLEPAPSYSFSSYTHRETFHDRYGVVPYNQWGIKLQGRLRPPSQREKSQGCKGLIFTFRPFGEDKTYTQLTKIERDLVDMDIVNTDRYLPRTEEILAKARVKHRLSRSNRQSTPQRDFEDKHVYVPWES